MNVFNSSNPEAINNLNNLMDQLNSEYYRNNTLNINNNQLNNNQFNYNTQQNKNKESLNESSINKKIEKEIKKQEYINNKYNSYHNSKDKFINDNNNMINQNINSISSRQSNFNYVNNVSNNSNLADKQTVNKKPEFQKDIRENINNKMDSRLFDNPILYNNNQVNNQVNNQLNNQVNNHTFETFINQTPKVQSRSKQLYKQEANERLNEYSPLSRSAYIPVNYSTNQTNKYKNTMSPRDIMNQRINQMPLLSCNIPLKKPNSDNKNITSTTNHESKILNELSKINYNDVNKGCNNVVNTNLPVFTK